MSEDPVLKIWLAEYDKLKAEQTQRIGFRDNLLYVTLGLFGVIIPTAISNPANYYALLVIPWISLILGWTYLINDEKISAIGRYIRLTLVDKIKEKVGHNEVESLFGWEIAHRDTPYRNRRKIEQLVVDEITFVLSGIVALITFFLLIPNPAIVLYLLGGVELLLLLILGWEIIIYADLAKGR
ncbi:MAG: hypothetical protein B0A82_10740 [Alkalinema sp. CACIAM 70d]|nr:MAG: hypothetical protein B0A82_10740 [Alkalinema sp. CACIAM 70d]